MFGRKQRKHSVIDTLIGPNSRINGDLQFEGGCHIDGTVKGSVSSDPESNSAVSISEEGGIEGGVNVSYVVLNGIVRGDVHANQRVELGPTARVIGNVYYNLIELAIGAEINGKLVHQPDGKIPLPDRRDSEIESPVKIVSNT
ncbi:Integral membrane protein CcmA involved in cell shape determination [uncultured Woeseiaceae bacterium]|uniref:Integral membrane protein CcmA involved in cell shape determination n=1 Tax=uncultured Woeseiaceae bacterium TaxID=1983305 RepID=A0A7D9H4G8_9GAMM|nr:Integral membrane protein CcmA involved in cell shape determination [uncultured Woeseiaceae bacterium]